jgi:hypothetical protein
MALAAVRRLLAEEVRPQEEDPSATEVAEVQIAATTLAVGHGVAAETDPREETHRLRAAAVPAVRATAVTGCESC